MLARRPAAIRLGRMPFLLVAVALVVTACATGNGTTASPTPSLAPSPSPADNPYSGAAAGSGAGVKIGYISYGDLVPFVADVSSGIRAQATAAGAQLVECDAALDASKVAGCVKQMTDAGVKGLIQFQGNLSDPAVACAALPAGLPVVAIEFPQAPCAKTLVHADDQRAGQIAGLAVGTWVKQTWSCTYDAYLALGSTGAAERSQLRIEGFRQGFTTQCPITNEQSGPRADTVDTANAAITDLLATLAGKTKILVVAMNDDGAIGALDGATAAGRSADVFVTAQGGDSRARAQIRTNAQWIGDSAYFPENYGKTAVPALLDLIAGKSVPADLLVAPAWIDKSTIGTYYPN